MAQFRTTADYIDSILNKCGEPTNGNSDYEADVLLELNKMHQKIISGSSVFDFEVDETWSWARARTPLIIELQPKYTSSSVTLTNGSESGSFAVAPSQSLQGWFLQIDGDKELYRIIAHTAAATSFELDAYYTGTGGSGLAYKAIKLDYDLVPAHIYITDRNNKIDFEETNSTPFSATLTNGTYTPSDLATHATTVLNAVANTNNTYTVTYDSITRKFTFASNLSTGSTVFELLGGSGTNQGRSALPSFGFDKEDRATAASHVSVYPLGGISRLIEPFRVYGRPSKDAGITGIDPLTMSQDYPLTTVEEGIPEVFSRINESEDGLITVRFDRYPKQATKIEVEHIPVPLDLKDSTASIPLIPRKFCDMLEYGGIYFVKAQKNQDDADRYLQLAQAQLRAMQRQNRSEQQKTGKHFGQLIAREDKISHRVHPRNKRYGYDSGEY